jgi:N-acetylmuramic acid 6-phosphate etherase
MAADEYSQRMGDSAFVAALMAGQRRAVEAVAAALPSLEQAAFALSEKLEAGGRLIYLGAGSSGLIAIQDGAEIPGTFGVPHSRIVFLIAGGVANAHRIDGAAEDDREAALREIDALGSMSADAIIAISASGSTPYTVAGAEAAHAKGATVISLASRAASPLLSLADHPIFLDTGPEALQGSTRLGAGTAQKCALGLLSTLANARLGHVYRGLMVNVRPDNDKLRRRAVDIIASIAGVEENVARRSLAVAGDDVKCAVLIASGLGPREKAQALLAQSRGDIGAALSRSKQGALTGA